MTIEKNIIIEGKHKKPILVDVFFKNDEIKKPILIFCHGYKGFKDWGAWNIMAKRIAESGFCVIKFNFSHYGGTVEQPIDFLDLEAFGNNNYTKELYDLESVINWVSYSCKLKNNGDINDIILLGHSRAGGIVTIKAEENNKVKTVITLAGVCDYGKRTIMNKDIEQWKNIGVIYVLNGRTKQKMPHYYQFYENFINNEERLTIKRAVLNLKIPYLIIHGDHDTTISVNEAKYLHSWNTNSKLEIIKGANHVFGAQHPWYKQTLPNHLKQVTVKIVDFLLAR